MLWGPIALTAATSAMIGVSLAPAIGELRRRQDAAPLPTRADDGHITNFAAAFRKRIAPLMPELERCDMTHEVPFGDGTRALLLPIPDIPVALPPEITAVLLSGKTARVYAGAELLCDLYACGELILGTGCTLRALLADGDARLSYGCVIARWAHSEGALEVAAGCTLFGRLSATREIQLAQGCRFERMHAPVIRVGDEAAALPKTRVIDKRSIVDVKLGRLLAHGDFHLASGDVLQGHVVASGDVLIDGGSRIMGSVKSHGRTEIGAGTEIHGALVSASSLRLAGETFLRGPILAEGELVIGPGTIIGAPDAPTTISAPRIRIAPGSVIHGSVWARYEGITASIENTARNAA